MSSYNPKDPPRDAESWGNKLEPVRVWLLGGFRVSVGERKVDESAWRLRKAPGLIKLLSLAAGHRMHRERAMALLWPKLAKKAASNNLRQSLHVARRTLHPDPQIASGYLSVSGEQLLMCPQGELWVDVDAFEEAADTARRSRDPAAYRAATELYSGELLPEERYEGWAEERRETLRQTHLRLLVELARLYEERGEIGPAIDTLGEAVRQEPTVEQAHASLMRLYALSGRKGEAITQYGRLEEILARELGTEPAATSRALREEIASGRLVAKGQEVENGGKLPDTVKGVTSHNLPASRSSFVGREWEILEVKRVLAMTRLLTLTGVGGSGKTRLALEVGRDLVSAYPDGVWLVELAGISEEELVPQAVAEALSVKEQPGQPLTDTLVESLHNKSMLVMVDNCEHLIDAAAHLADALLDGCPRLRILATSREALGVAGESLWQVPTLSVPDSSQRMPTVEELEGYEAARLFVERASDRRPGFALEPANVASVAEVCRRLDGVPLAIELAAARVGTMSLEQISERLENPLGLLTGGGRTAVRRQRTLRGALDWSHELLSNEEQTLFRRLSVFAGGWMLEAAEAVAAGEGIGEGRILELLSGLIDKSLVVAEASREGMVRYRLLEPIRQYALEKLEVSGEAEALRHRHTEHFLALAEEAEQKFRGPEEARWLDRLEAEHDNMRVAFSWALGVRDAGLGSRLAAALWKFWTTRGYYGEGARWLQEALEKSSTDTPSAARAGILSGLGSIMRLQSNFEQAQACHEEALELYEVVGDRRRVAESLGELGWVAKNRGDTARAMRIFEKSLAIAWESRNLRGAPEVLIGLAYTVFESGAHERAGRLLEEALTLAREQGSPWTTSNLLFCIGYKELALGNLERAIRHFEKSLALSRELAYTWGVKECLFGLGVVATLRGNPEEANTLLKESLTMDVQLGTKADIAEDLEGLAAVAGAKGEHVRATRLWGAAAALREATDRPWWSAERLLHEPQLTAARARLDQASWDAAFEEGQTMSFEEVVEYALSEQIPITPASPTPDQLSAVELSSTLTAREREVTAMIAQGMTNRQIAQEFYLSERTIENHVSKILRKLGRSSRSEIAAWATEQRLIAP